MFCLEWWYSVEKYSTRCIHSAAWYFFQMVSSNSAITKVYRWPSQELNSRLCPNFFLSFLNCVFWSILAVRHLKSISLYWSIQMRHCPFSIDISILLVKLYSSVLKISIYEYRSHVKFWNTRHWLLSTALFFGISIKYFLLACTAANCILRTYLAASSGKAQGVTQYLSNYTYSWLGSFLCPCTAKKYNKYTFLYPEKLIFILQNCMFFYSATSWGEQQRKIWTVRSPRENNRRKIVLMLREFPD